MKPVARTPAENTVLVLEQAARGDSPLMIPGAWDARTVSRAVRVTESADSHSTVPTKPSAASAREQLEREREGGGAPSQRRRGHRASLLTRLWRSTLHPTEIAVIWSRTLPQPL